jgi:single-stranded DNA-binding protein|nr:MAG TPA: Single strand binding protein [Caudoviricetes sp.]
MLKAELIGNLGNDAEIKEFGGKKYVALSVATTEYAKDDQGNRTDVTTWVSVLWYGEGGGLFAYLKRGAKVFVRGNLRAKMYADKQGVQQVSINVNASEVQLCGSKAEASPQQPAPAAPAKGNSAPPQPTPAPVPQVGDEPPF